MLNVVLITNIPPDWNKEGINYLIEKVTYICDKRLESHTTPDFVCKFDQGVSLIIYNLKG